jgi:hypothetical protein
MQQIKHYDQEITNQEDQIYHHHANIYWMRTLKPRNLNLKFQTFKAHNQKYLSYPKLVRDATLYFRTAKRANGMRKFQCQEVKNKMRGLRDPQI